MAIRKIISLVIPLVALTCGGARGESGACEGFADREIGIKGAKYRPCAGEIMATLDSLRPHLNAYTRGDDTARGRARPHYRRLRGLIRQIGIENDYRSLEAGTVGVKWPDREVQAFNRAAFQASVMYSAALAARKTDQVGAGTRDNFQQGVKAHEDAKRFYLQIH